MAVGFALTVMSCRCGVPPGVVNECTGELLPPATISTDILFVIDNSFSMAEEQAKVVAELNTFLSSLANAPVQNDFQVGVITTAITLQGQACQGGPLISLDYPEHSGRLQLGKNLYQQTDASGPPLLANPGADGLGLLLQGNLELSNVDPVRELVELIRTQRAFELNSQSIQTADGTLDTLNQLALRR